jgi:hypothetical protein
MMLRSLPLLVAGTALAQVPYVSPAHFATTEAPANNTFPFGYAATPFRYQQIHDDVPAMAITGLAFRHNAGPLGMIAPPFTVTLDAWISTAATSSQTAYATFDLNHGPDRVQCVTNRTITIGGNDPIQLPSEWTVQLPFDPGIALAFTGAPASVCWEVQITARTNTSSVAFDAVPGGSTIPTNPNLAATLGGVGCIASGQLLPMRVVPSANLMDWPLGMGGLSVSASYLQPNAMFAWITGLDRTTWSGMPLPFVLPGTATSASGTCTLYTDIVLAAADVASSLGTGQFHAALTVTPVVHGFTIFTQAVAFDPAANPFGFTASNLAVQQLVAPYPTTLPATRVFASGSLAATGTLNPAIFLVTRFQ